MATYYIEPILTRDNEVVGFSEIKETSSRSKSILAGKIKIDMNGIEYNDYIANVKDYYLSGSTLYKIDKIAQMNA